MSNLCKIFQCQYILCFLCVFKCNDDNEFHNSKKNVLVPLVCFSLNNNKHNRVNIHQSKGSMLLYYETDSSPIILVTKSMTLNCPGRTSKRLYHAFTRHSNLSFLHGFYSSIISVKLKQENPYLQQNKFLFQYHCISSIYFYSHIYLF